MPAAFHVNNFKPWTPSHTKPFFPHKSPNPLSHRNGNLPRPKPRHDSLLSTLPHPKHQLPARPPTEVCMRVSTDSRPHTPLTSQSRPRDISVALPDTSGAKTIKLSTTCPHNQTTPASDSDPTSPHAFQEAAKVPIEPPSFPGDTTEDSLSSPSISSSDYSFEELPDIQNIIPIDPVILDNFGPWEASDLHQSIPQCHNLAVSETACSYPEPPPVFHSLPEGHRDHSEGTDSQNGNPQPCQHHQLHSSQHSTDLDASYSNDAREKRHVGGQSNPSKRKTQQSDRRGRKRLRAPSTSPSKENSFNALRSHFVSLPLDERLQFLSWLFKGALPRCMSDLAPTAGQHGDSRANSGLILPGVMEQTQRGSRKVQESSRKGRRWSPEEAELLLKLRKDENRSWPQVARLFSEEYPGRSPGAIQVYWSTTLNKKAD